MAKKKTKKKKTTKKKTSKKKGNLTKEQQEFIGEYLNNKPKIQEKGGFWNNILGFFAVAAKAYLRYEASEYKR